MSDVKRLRIAKNKIDRIEDFSFPSQNMIGNITLEGKVDSCKHYIQLHLNYLGTIFVSNIYFITTNTFRKSYSRNSIFECSNGYQGR